jgi:hypothetical protein
MSSSLMTEAPAADFICGSESWMHSACEGLPFYGKHDGTEYCILHYPGKKNPYFEHVIRNKLNTKDYDFGGVWFPDDILLFDRHEFTAPVNFAFATFSAGAYFTTTTKFGADADFRFTKFDADANFQAATFNGKADFRNSKFSTKVDFSEVWFGGRANFIGAVFHADADFSYARFEGDADFTTIFLGPANFNYARFAKEAYFRLAEFNGEVNFRSATFSTYARFGGGGRFKDSSFLDLQFTRIEKPERVSFDRLVLRPYWFVNVDSRKFDFINIAWPDSLTAEIAALKAKKTYPSHRLLATAYRHLAVNAEENHRYGEASKFRYRSMEARRLEISVRRAFRWLIRSLRRDWKARGGIFARLRRVGRLYWRSLDPLHWVYWIVSGYGERVFQAFVVLVGVWILFAILYTQVGFVRSEPKAVMEKDAVEAKRDEAGAPLQLSRAFAYSASVMTLQKPEPRPATNAAQASVMLETILGPVQAALLALAIRRKFMR